MLKVGLFPGAFKPPHKGHFMVVEDLLLQCDEVIILISPKDRENITQQNSVDIWRLYIPLFDGKVSLWVVPENAVTEAYAYLSKYPQHQFVLAFGKDDEKRFNAAKNKERYPNAEVLNAGNNLGFSATTFRQAIKNRDMDTINMYLPNGANVLRFMEIMNLNLHEAFSVDWWEKELHLNEILGPTDVRPNGELPDSELTNEFVQFVMKALKLDIYDFTLNLTQVPLQDTFGTFNPSNKEITIYWGKERAFADKARTLAHEMVHAYQMKNNKPLNGATGSPCENEANAMAGVILRKFKDIHPEIFTI